MREKRSSLAWLWWTLGIVACVAVAGIVVSVTVVADNASKFQCRAKQSEAKSNLAGLFTAEKMFRGEYRSYSTDLVSVQWMPDGAPHYLYGFAQTSRAGEATLLRSIPGYDPARSATDHLQVIGSPVR